MSIGSCNSLAKFVANSWAKSLYNFIGSQVQQSRVFTVSLGALVSLALMLSAPANAKILDYYVTPYPKVENFIDFEYAQKMWVELKTLDDFKNEEIKYSSFFDKWLEEDYKADKDKAIKRIREAPLDEEGIALKKGHDLAVLFDVWQYECWLRWRDAFRRGVWSKTFSTLVKEGKMPMAFTKPVIFTEHLPDWRNESFFESEKKLFKERGLYQEKEQKEDAYYKKMFTQ